MAQEGFDYAKMGRFFLPATFYRFISKCTLHSCSHLANCMDLALFVMRLRALAYAVSPKYRDVLCDCLLDQLY